MRDELAYNLEFLQVVSSNKNRTIPAEVATHIRLAKQLLVDSLHDEIVNMPVKEKEVS